MGRRAGAAPSYRAPENGRPVCIPKVAPGQWIAPAPEYHGAGMQLVFDAISFKDGAGRSWRRDAKGALEQTERSPLDDLDISRPVSYSMVGPYTGE